MSTDDTSFDNGDEFLKHRNRKDGKHDLIYGKKGEKPHNHAIFNENGGIAFLREDGQIKANDNYHKDNWNENSVFIPPPPSPY